MNAGGLQALGHDAVHVRDIGLGEASDQADFSLAAREHRAIVTADLDFADIVAASGVATVSVVLLRLRDTAPADALPRLRAILPEAEAHLDAGAAETVAENRIGVRGLPVTR